MLPKGTIVWGCEKKKRAEELKDRSSEEQQDHEQK